MINLSIYEFLIAISKSCEELNGAACSFDFYINENQSYGDNKEYRFYLDKLSKLGYINLRKYAHSHGEFCMVEITLQGYEYLNILKSG